MTLTHDAFLGGRLTITQPAAGFRAGVDTVLLAAACPARDGDRVLELGCGVGTASLCLGDRVAVALHAVEFQAEYADLARANAAANGHDLRLWSCDLRDMPVDLRTQSFDHVIANPPYFQRSHGTQAADQGRDTALGGDTPLADWLRVAAKRLSPKGWLTMIQRMDRLPDMLAGLPADLGSVRVLPIAARTGRPAHLCLMQARKQGRAPFALMAPFIMHDGAAHLRDGDDYTPQARAILRDGAALPWGN